MNNQTISKWFSMFIFMVMAGIGSLSAQTLSIDDFEMKAGGTSKVSINLVQGYSPVLGFQFDLVLPEGLTVTGRPKAVAETLNEDVTPTVTYSNGRFVVYNSESLTFKDDATSIVTFTVEAASDFQGGEIFLENIVMSGEGNVKIQPETVYAQVTSDYVAPITTEPTLLVNDFFISAGTTKQVTIDLVKGYSPVLGFQFDLVLPDGLTVTGRPKAVAETLNEDETPTVTYSNGRFVVYNSESLTFKDDATSIVTFTVEAASDFQGGEIYLENIVVSGEGNVKIQPKAVYAQVISESGKWQDVTDLVQNADCSSMNGWNYWGHDIPEYLDGSWATWHIYQSGTYTNGDITIAPVFIERWVYRDTYLENGALSQTISGLKNGLYRFEADIIACQQGEHTGEVMGAYLYTETSGGRNAVSTSTGNGQPKHYTVYARVNNGELTIGFETLESNMNWIVIDNVKLYVQNDETIITDDDPTLDFDGFEMNPGTTASFPIAFVPGSTPVLAFQADLMLPYGMSVLGVRAYDETLAEDETPTVTYSNGRLLVYNTENLAFKQQYAPVVEFTVGTASYFEGGTIGLTNIVISGVDNERITADNMYVEITSNYSQIEREKLELLVNNAITFINKAQNTGTYYAYYGAKGEFESALSYAQRILEEENDAYMYREAANSLKNAQNNLKASMASYDVLKQYVNEVLPECITLANTCGLTWIAEEFQSQIDEWNEVWQNGEWTSEDIDYETEEVHYFLVSNISPEMIPVGTDITCLMVNPSFDNRTNGWDVYGRGYGNYGTVCVNDTVDYHNMESWRNTFYANQTIANMPAGLYEITLQGFVRNEFDMDNPESEIRTNMYAGNSTARFMNVIDESQRRPVDDSEPLWTGGSPDRIYEIDGVEYYAPHGMAAANAYFNTINPLTGEPYYTTHFTAELLEDGDFTFGVSSNTEEWVLFDNIHIKYIGASEKKENYARALKSVVDGGQYHIFTDVDNTRYYLNDDGYIVDNPSDAALFTFHSEQADGTLFTIGWNINGRFTNSTLSNGASGELIQEGHLNTNPYNRVDWERQALFQNEEGLFAIRATNAKSENWGGNTYWDVVEYNGELAAGYSLEMPYIWQIAYDEAAGMNILIKDERYLSGDSFVGYQPNITLQQTNYGVDYGGMPSTLGALTIADWADQPLNMGKLTMNYNPAQSNYCRYNGFYYPAQYTTLIARGEASAEEIDIRMNITDGSWNFISLPYDVRMSDITCEIADVDWVIRRYDGEKRAAGLLSETWVNVGYDEILEAGKGYIMHCNNDPSWLYNSCVFHFPAYNKKERVFATDDLSVDLEKYDGEFSQNRNWNLIGNPYAAYVEIGNTSFNAPITVWNGNGSYIAYSPFDDRYVLTPGEAFFVQCPEDESSITFFADGRMSLYEIAYSEGYYAKRKARASQENRKVYNIILSDGERSDQTRVVFNEEASKDYEMTRDASKFMAMDASAPQIYSSEGNVQYAINERPLDDGIVQLATYFGQEGTYTLSLNTTSDQAIFLKDEVTGSVINLSNEESYEFQAEAGTTTKRFSLVADQDGTTSIPTVAAEELNGVRIYTIDGRSMSNKPAAAGIYMIRKNGSFRKVYVK